MENGKLTRDIVGSALVIGTNDTSVVAENDNTAITKAAVSRICKDGNFKSCYAP